MLKFIEIKDIREGDKFVDRVSKLTIWTAETDAKLLATGDIQIRVRHTDGGADDRVWSPKSASMQLPIVRGDL